MRYKWKQATLSELCSKIGSGATPRGGKESYKNAGIALIRSQNILDFSFSRDGLAFIDERQARQLENVSVQKGDVLINITGDSVARACLAPENHLPARVNQHVAIVRAVPQKVNSIFILYTLQYKKAHLLSLASSGGTRNALTKRMLEELSVDLPPLEEQQRIVATISALDDKIILNIHINHCLAA
ncbi:MAG TPA: restriction endonuclease subunit S [Desulfitobacteriaceae bacterium]|nr:restriction endonuclease subunit S [Desulfitobacteriaceae bacterium]